MKNIIKKRMTKEAMIKLAVSAVISILIMVIIPELSFPEKFLLKQSIKNIY